MQEALRSRIEPAHIQTSVQFRCSPADGMSAAAGVKGTSARPARSSRQCYISRTTGGRYELRAMCTALGSSRHVGAAQQPRRFMQKWTSASARHATRPGSTWPTSVWLLGARSCARCRRRKFESVHSMPPGDKAALRIEHAKTKGAPHVERLSHCWTVTPAARTPREITANNTCRTRPGAGSSQNARLRSSSAR